MASWRANQGRSHWIISKEVRIPLRRREFIALLGGVSAVWPLAARAYHPSVPMSGTPFTYSLLSPSNTSAGVYFNGWLIKTLWSNVPTNAGSHNATWDATDDLGHLLPSGTYEVRIVSSNPKYTWMGVIGNTSARR